MFESLKQQVFEANMLLLKYDLVTFTWGNVSGIDREKGVFAIKPSGVDYTKLTPDAMVIINLDGKTVEGNLTPSSDTVTHLELYKAFAEIGGIVHTHSPMATAWAQTGRGIPCYGTTHADYFYGEIPCCRDLFPDEIQKNYEKNTGKVIIETFQNKNPIDIPGILCKSHGPFTWGKDSYEAVQNAVILEEIAKINAWTELLQPHIQPVSQTLLNKHFLRKHGDNAYYGQISY